MSFLIKLRIVDLKVLDFFEFRDIGGIFLGGYQADIEHHAYIPFAIIAIFFIDEFETF